MKKIFVLLLSCIIAVSSVPMESYAVTETSSMTKDVSAGSNNTDSSDKALESAILAVKNKITIPKEYSQFNYYINESNLETSWYMTWTDPTTYSYIQVNCDSKNHISYYYKYDNKNKKSGIAKYLKSELKTKADDFIKIIAPETANNLKFMNVTYEGIYSGDYAYNYQRVYKGIDFPDNTVTILVNSISGEVSGASISWLYDVTVPSSATKLNKTDAAALIKDNMKMKLIYRSDYYNIYDEKGNLTTEKKAFLVYEPTEAYISINANTGEVYKSRETWVNTNGNSRYDKETAKDEAGYGGASSLTDEEMKKVEELKKLISKSKAIETVTKNPYLYIDKNLKAYTATLSKQEDGGKGTSYVWNISLSDPRPVNYDKDTDYYRGYASATVDAETGKILSFYTSLKSNYDEVNQKWNTVKIKYNQEKSKEILEKFLKSQIKDRFDHSVLVSQNDDYVAYYKDKTPVYGGYSYQYNRVNEGIEYPYNNIYGAVDGVSGKVYSFGSYWDKNITFESSKGAMSADKAMEYYLGKDGFGLKYEINTINQYDTSNGKDDKYYENTNAYNVKNEIRLVYRPDINPSYISPFTGEQLTYNGEVYKEAQPYSYLDIKDAVKYRNILLLSDMNIGFEGEYFKPDQNITYDELNQLLEKVGYANPTTDKSKNSSLITREEAAYCFIINLGLEKVAKLKGIYSTGYADESSIKADYIGAVALAKGFGIMKDVEFNNFYPKNNINRYDAVNLFLSFIDVQQGGVY